MFLTNGIDYTVDANGRYTFAARPSGIGYQATIKYQSSIPAVSALQALGLNLATGSIGQGVWGYLQSQFPAQALPYSGLAYVYSSAYDLGGNAEVENHSFEIQTPHAITATGDADPSVVARDLLTNARYGAAFPSSRINAASLANWSQYALAANLTMSPVLAQQKAASEWLQYLCQLSNVDVTWSQSQLKFVPLGDAYIASAYASWSPNTTPVFDLTEDHFVTQSADDDPVKIERKASDDTYNHVRVEFNNRANAYNAEIAEAKDAADIDRRGLRTKDVVEAHAICEPQIARILAALLLQREMAVRNVYKFRLPWPFALLEPLDLVTVTDPYLGLSRVPVRINKITETDSHEFDIEAEDCPIGMASAPLYGPQAGSGFAHDYNVAPGGIVAPFFFELPVQMTPATGLEVAVAVAGAGASWGGCRVWASTDGVQYKQVGRIAGSARYGQMTAAIGTSGTDTVSVTLAGRGGQILSGSASDAAALQTLLFVGDASGGEYMTYQGAALAGANKYNLTTLGRGVYYSTPKARAANVATVVRVDEAIATSGPLQTNQVGQKLFFKFTSFNIYGGAEEQLAGVPAYTYTPSGYMLKIPPPAPAGMTFDGVKFAWPAVNWPRNLLAGYEIRFQYGSNQSYADAIPLQADVITANPYVAPTVPQGSVTFMLRAVDIFGNRSATGPVVQTNLGDAATSNVLQAQDFKALGWPGTITGVAAVSGGNIVATNAAAMFGSPTQPALLGAATDPEFASSQYAGISYSTPQFLAAAPGKMTLLHTIVAAQFQVNYRPSNPASAFGSSQVAAAFVADGTAAEFPPQPGWQAWPGTIQAIAQPYEFQIVCGVGTTQQQITRLIAQVDVPDVNLRLSGVAVPAAGVRLAAAVGKFNAITNVNLTLQGGAGSTAVSAKYLDKSTTQGPLIVCTDAANNQVAGVVDALIQGY